MPASCSRNSRSKTISCPSADCVDRCPNNDIAAFEDHLGYHFKDKKVLIEALTHRSFYHENPDKAENYNERLEFLGDSVLGFVIVEYLFSSRTGGLRNRSWQRPNHTSSKNRCFPKLQIAISLGKYLRLGKGEEATGGRTKRSLLADAVEAVLGAVYLDGGYKKAQELILRLFKEKIEAIMSLRRIPRL